jgi:hypothetical protein
MIHERRTVKRHRKLFHHSEAAGKTVSTRIAQFMAVARILAELHPDIELAAFGACDQLRVVTLRIGRFSRSRGRECGALKLAPWNLPLATNSMLAGQECDVLRAKRCFCSFDGFEEIGDRLWPNVRKDRERLAEQIAQHDRRNT